MGTAPPQTSASITLLTYSSLAGDKEPLSTAAQNEAPTLSWDFQVVRQGTQESHPNPVWSTWDPAKLQCSSHGPSILAGGRPRCHSSWE